MVGRKSAESWKLVKNIHAEKRKEILALIVIEKWEQCFQDLLTENKPAFTDDEDKRIRINTVSSPLRISQ